MLPFLSREAISLVSQILTHKESQASDLRAEIGRSSVPHRLAHLQKQFDDLGADLGLGMRRKLAYHHQEIEPYISQIHDAIKYSFVAKDRELLNIQNRLEISNPKKQLKHSWAQINKDGKKIALDEIEIGDEFDITNEKIRMRVKGLSRVSI